MTGELGKSLCYKCPIAWVVLFEERNVLLLRITEFRPIESGVVGSVYEGKCFGLWWKLDAIVERLSDSEFFFGHRRVNLKGETIVKM